MITVLATREGLLGHRTSSGYIIDDFVPFVALPSKRACHDRELVRIMNPLTGLFCYAFVLDVGPWNTSDDAYVYGGNRPQAESGIDLFGRTTNKAGIDLGQWVWKAIGMVDNSDVTWSFVARV